MKAEHYLKSGLNTIPTSVMSLADCVAVATGERRLDLSQSFDGDGAKRETVDTQSSSEKASHPAQQNETAQRSSGGFRAFGRGLPSQDSFKVKGRALVTDSPITFLGFVNRETGVIEEQGHPADGQSIAGKIVIFPRGSGSTVAPYVLLELYYRGRAPLAVINTEIDQQTAPACSLEGIPYAYGFDADLFSNIKDNDLVELSRHKGKTEIRVLVI
jgi:predicted aconitase with swiveling domain